MRESKDYRSDYPQVLAGCVFNVGGVLLTSPHERAWYDALPPKAAISKFTPEFYQAHMRGKSRLEGARAAMHGLGIADARHEATNYAERKQAILAEMVARGDVKAYEDALIFLRVILGFGVKVAAASASTNAISMLKAVAFAEGQSLYRVFNALVCGRALRAGRPDPEMFLLAAVDMDLPAANCCVIEDWPPGIVAARAAGMGAVGLARSGDTAPFYAAGADLVVRSLLEIDVGHFAAGRLRRKVGVAVG